MLDIEAERNARTVDLGLLDARVQGADRAALDNAFGWAVVSDWATAGEASSSVKFQGNGGFELGRINLFGATVSDVGTCVDGVRSATIVATYATQG